MQPDLLYHPLQPLSLVEKENVFKMRVAQHKLYKRALTKLRKVNLLKRVAEGEFFGPCTKKLNLQAKLNHISRACFAR